MAAAYATFADGGVYHAPLLITAGDDGRWDGVPLPVTAGEPGRADAVPGRGENYVLQQVVLRGTGVAAGDVGSPVAGKTGTTENSTDAWFIGYTPKLTTAVWMGYAKSDQPMVNFRGLQSIQGGTIPAELWHNYMAAVLAILPAVHGEFPPVYLLSGRR